VARKGTEREGERREDVPFCSKRTATIRQRSVHAKETVADVKDWQAPESVTTNNHSGQAPPTFRGEGRAGGRVEELAILRIDS